MRPGGSAEQAVLAHDELLATHSDHVVTHQLPSPSILGFSIDQYGLFG